MASLALSVVYTACDGKRYATEEQLRAWTACPSGVDEEVLGTYTPDCVRDLFHGAIRLVEPGDRYYPASFNISTPASPHQLQAVYGSKTHNESEVVRLNIDPPDVLPLFAPTEEVRIGQLVVEIAASDSNRMFFYWQQGGWRYTLEVPVASESDREAALDLIRQAR